MFAYVPSTRDRGTAQHIPHVVSKVQGAKCIQEGTCFLKDLIISQRPEDMPEMEARLVPDLRRCPTMGGSRRTLMDDMRLVLICMSAGLPSVSAPFLNKCFWRSEFACKAVRLPLKTCHSAMLTVENQCHSVKRLCSSSPTAP